MTPDKNKLMSYLYGEMNEEEEKLFEAEIAASPELQAELKELQEARSMMSEWKDILPEPVKTPAYKIKRNISYSWFAAGIAASFFIISMISILAGAEVNYSREHGISIALGGYSNNYVEQKYFKEALDSALKKQVASKKEEKIIPAPLPVEDNKNESQRKAELTPEEMQKVINLVNAQNGKNLNAILTVLQQNQEKQLDMTLRVFANYLEQQRKTDIQTIGTEMEKIKRSSDSKFYETDLAINKLFQTVQYPNK